MKAKKEWSWIGKALLAGATVLLLGSMLAEFVIYALADKMTEAYASGYEVTFR